MQGARLDDLFQLPPQTGQLLIDRAPVGFDLCLTGTAHKAKPAALAFKVGPGPHKPRALIGQRSHFDLQDTFTRRRAIRENLENEAGPIKKLRFPRPLEIALLNRRHRPVDQHQPDVFAFDLLT